MKTCDECGGAHHAKGKCKKHYRMPSQLNPKPLKRVKVKINWPDTRPLTKHRKESLPELLARAEKVFNARIRKRDAKSDGTFRCISCSKWHSAKEMDAGHFISKKQSSVRFNELNVWGQCHECNRMKDGNYKLYRQSLIDTIGLSLTEHLEWSSKQPFKWDRESLLKLIEKYK